PLGVYLGRRLVHATSLSNRRFIVIAVVVFVLTRLAAVLLVPTLPVSDFESYRMLARLMVTGQPLPQPTEQFFFAWGYPLVLAPLIAAFGDSLLAAKLFNVVVGLVSLPLIWPIAYRVGGMPVARAAVLLYVLWPAQLFMTPVLASEHLALLLSLIYLLCVLWLIEGRRVVLASIVGVASLGLACAIRPALGVLLPIGLVMFFTIRRGVWLRSAILPAVALVGGFAGTQFGYRALLSGVYGGTPPTVAWWNLMVGLNYDARGRWNQQDAEPFFAYPTLDESNQYARGVVWQRLTTRPYLHPNLVRRKLELLWGDNYYGVWWSTGKMADGAMAKWIEANRHHLYTWSQIGHIAGLVLCAMGVFPFIRQRSDAATLMLLLILAGSALHSVFETQTRYSHVFTLGVIVFAAAGLAGRRRLSVRHD
ncbi:MAG: glycosyltransferase family 39 protein, partial [Phycisphaerae bacterium]|nr:glycosyltransferase family 39 protein [Phycisphaerae bacterium]